MHRKSKRVKGAACSGNPPTHTITPSPTVSIANKLWLPPCAAMTSPASSFPGGQQFTGSASKIVNDVVPYGFPRFL